MSDETAKPEAAESSPPDAKPAAVTAGFEAPSEYAAAIDRVLALATREVLVFDNNLSLGEWGTQRRAETLRRLFLDHRASRMQVIVHDTRHIEQSLPRLANLLREFSHKLEIRRTVGDGRSAWEGFVLVDGRHLVHRFHLDAVRGEVSTDNPRKAADLRERYDQTHAWSEPGMNATTLGL